MVDRLRPGDLVELTKPRIVLMVMLTVAVGFWMASPAGGQGLLLFHLLFGTALVAAGTNALNQVAERDLDAMMHRTKERPLPAGRLSVREAASFAWLMGIVRTRSCVGRRNVDIVCVLLHTTQTPHLGVHSRRCSARGASNSRWMGGSHWNDRVGGVGSLLDPLSLATAALPCSRLAVSRGLCPG